jgi:hypothetical protein
MKAAIGPPSFCAAVTAANDETFRAPSFCSRTARLESRRACAEENCGTATGRGVRKRERAWRRADREAGENMMAGWRWDGELEEREPQRRTIGSPARKLFVMDSLEYPRPIARDRRSGTCLPRPLSHDAAVSLQADDGSLDDCRPPILLCFSHLLSILSTDPHVCLSAILPSICQNGRTVGPTVALQAAWRRRASRMCRSP